MSLKPDDQTMDEDDRMDPSVTTFSQWPKGRTTWPSQQTSALLKCDPDSGGFSIAYNDPNSDRMIEGLSDALSRLPACGEQYRKRQREAGMGDGGYHQRKEDMAHIRKSFAESDIRFFEGIDRADWAKLQKDPKTSVLYPAWHLPNSEVYNHHSSIPPQSRLQRAQPLDGSIQPPNLSRPSGLASTNSNVPSVSNKRSAPAEYGTPKPKRQTIDWPANSSIRSTKAGGGTEMTHDAEMGEDTEMVDDAEMEDAEYGD
jgi:hypothetical protein